MAQEKVLHDQQQAIKDEAVRVAQCQRICDTKQKYRYAGLLTGITVALAIVGGMHTSQWPLRARCASHGVS